MSHFRDGWLVKQKGTKWDKDSLMVDQKKDLQLFQPIIWGTNFKDIFQYKKLSEILLILSGFNRDGIQNGTSSFRWVNENGTKQEL